MKRDISSKICVFTVLVLYAFMVFPLLSYSKTSGVKTSYKRYSIFKYKNEDVLCEPYTVNKDDWLYKIFRKKGEISERDFPHFLFIFKEVNPQISNIDAIEPGISILIPLKKVKKEDYDLSSPGNVDVPVIEFSSLPEDLDLKPFLKKHNIQKGETVSTLIDKEFLSKSGNLSKEGLKAFQLANPNIVNINIVYEGRDIYLPDPAIKSQPWFQSFLSGETKQTIKDEERQNKIEAYQLNQLKKYSSLIGGVLLSQGKMYFPGENNSSQVLDLSSTPIIETDDGTKIVIIAGNAANADLLKSMQTYWKELKTQLLSEAIENVDNADRTTPKGNVTAEYKILVETLLSQTGYEYIPDAKIPFMLNNVSLEASFGRVIRKETTDLLINFGNVYGSALEALEKREFEIISITPKLGMMELVKMLFSHLGYSTWENPSFSNDETVETINGLYAVKEQEKLFIPITPLSDTAIAYLKKEEIRILFTKKPSVQ